MDARFLKGEEYGINLTVHLNFPSGLVMVGMAAKGLDQQLKAKKHLCFWNLLSCLLKNPLTISHQSLRVHNTSRSLSLSLSLQLHPRMALRRVADINSSF